MLNSKSNTSINKKAFTNQNLLKYDFLLSNGEIDVSWMTRSQKKYYEVLKNNRNVTKSIIQICKLAGYKSKASWYKSLENECFRTIVKIMGIDISIIENRYKGNDKVDIENIEIFDDLWMSPSQKKFFDVLKDEKNRNKPIRELISLSGIKGYNTWKRTLYSERYRNLLKSLGFEINYFSQEDRYLEQKDLGELKSIYTDIDVSNIKNIETNWMTRSQKKFYDVLKDENNRKKTVSEIIILAGYKSHQSWSLALSNEKFRYLLGLMGIDMPKFITDIKLNNCETYNILNPSDNNEIDTSWMTKPQKNFLNILMDSNNINLSPMQITKLAGYKSTDSWYLAIKSDRFSNLITSMGVELQLKKKAYKSHSEVEYISDPKERQKHLDEDVWDIRKLLKNYPLHLKPCRFIVDFRKIESPPLRKILKRYLENMFANWHPGSFSHNLYKISKFFELLYKLFPDINSFKELKRETHIEPVLQTMCCLYSTYVVNASLNAVRSMFKYMYTNKWLLGPSSNSLIIDYDIPAYAKALPKPIPIFIKKQLDEYLELVIITLLEFDKNTPIILPMFWDMIIILRYTGRRYEDLSHLIADGSDIDCLRYDLDGDPQLFTDHRIAKINKDIVVPLAHLKDSQGNNIVERAILRQKKRVAELPPVTADGYKYLFRRIKVENQGYATDTPILDKLGNPVIETINHDYFSDCILDRICLHLPIKDENNATYKITPHQFRHTVATEMIDAGIDIYAVKEFLGHTSVVMTERYIKVYQMTLKNQILKKLSTSDAIEVMNNLPQQKEVYDNKWVKNKIIGVFELGDGCCEHPYKMSSCPHMIVCKICFKRKIRPDHKSRVLETIDSYTTNRNQFISFGLTERATECDKIITFYTLALEVISNGDIFDPKTHLPKDFYNI